MFWLPVKSENFCDQQLRICSWGDSYILTKYTATKIAYRWAAAVKEKGLPWYGPRIRAGAVMQKTARERRISRKAKSDRPTNGRTKQGVESCSTQLKMGWNTMCCHQMLVVLLLLNYDSMSLVSYVNLLMCNVLLLWKTLQKAFFSKFWNCKKLTFWNSKKIEFMKRFYKQFFYSFKTAKKLLMGTAISYFIF